MRILQILPELNVGGVETGTVDFAKYLVAHGHHSVVVSNGGALVPGLEKSGSKHYSLPVHKKNIFTAIATIRKLSQIIAQEEIDIVHARSRVPAWIAFWACRKTKAAFLTTCHGYYSKHIFSHVMGWAKLIIVPSKIIARHMIDDFGVPAECIRQIPRSVDLKRFKESRSLHKSDPTPVITMVGRITQLKGYSYFLRAMAKVVRSVPNIRIWIIGEPPKGKDSYKKELEMLARRLGLTDYVEFLGNRKDVPHLLSKTDVLVLSSIAPESFGRVILEAQAAKVPVVATKVGGVVEIIDDEKTGLLVLPKDTDAMAKAVVRVLREPRLSKTLVANATEKIHREFTLQTMAERTLAVYEELLNSLNILVIKISAVGDVVLVTASLKALRKRYPHAKIHCLIGKESRKVLQGCPYVDELIVYDFGHKDKGLFRFLKLASRLRKNRFDILIDFQNNRKSHLLSFLSLPQKSYGYNNKKFGFLISNSVKRPRHDIDPVRHQFQVLNMLGIVYQAEYMLELYPSRHDKMYVNTLMDSEWLGDGGNIVGINLSASEKWKTKNWPLEHIARLCDLLAVENVRVVITGVEKDLGSAQELLRMTKAKPANFVGKTDILQLAALVEKCKVYLTPDSAPMHVAAAVGTPIVALFGPTDSVRHIPPACSIKVIEKEMNCAPCYNTHCRIATHDCMKQTSAEEVLNAIKELMAEKVQVA